MNVRATVSATSAGRGPAAVEDVSSARRRFYYRHLLLGALLVVLGAQLVQFLVTNPRFEWGVVAGYLFEPVVLRGLAMSLLLTVVGMVIGTSLGMVLAAAALSDFPPARLLARLYVSVFRGIPPLVQLVFWYNLAYLLPEIPLGLPFGPVFHAWPTNDVITPLTAAILGLSLHEGGYMTEIIRAGILGVDPGQREAAKAMGFTGGQTFFRIVLPQAMRVIIPPTGSQFISLLKGTSLVSVIAMTDLLHSVQLIYQRTYEVVPLLLVACIWYLAVVTVLTMVQQRLERRFSRGYRAQAV